MPRPRSMLMLEDPGGAGQCFHVLSRVVDKRFAFGDTEMAHFQVLLRKVEAFSGVRVVTWTMLANHFHIVVHVPERDHRPMSDELFWDRLGALYSRQELDDIRETMRLMGELNPGAPGRAMQAAYRQRFIDRMNHLSEFMKTLKQRFTQWFNQRHDRVGTLWESRFKSLVVEGDWDPLMRVAAYVDLNAVRAGLVRDPKDYRWCGYAEAVAGVAEARHGLALLFDDEAAGGRAGEEDVGGPAKKRRATWRRVGRAYRQLLFGTGEEKLASDDRTVLRRGMTREEVQAVWDAGGELTPVELLRCRLRYFSDGTVLGSKAFVDAFFAAKREHFGPRRQDGARRLRGGQWGDLRCLRDLRKNPIG